MNIAADWLDEKEERGIDVSILFCPLIWRTMKCPPKQSSLRRFVLANILCTGYHPFSTVERFGHRNYSRDYIDKPPGRMGWRASRIGFTYQ